MYCKYKYYYSNLANTLTKKIIDMKKITTLLFFIFCVNCAYSQFLLQKINKYRTSKKLEVVSYATQKITYTIKVGDVENQQKGVLVSVDEYGDIYDVDTKPNLETTLNMIWNDVVSKEKFINHFNDEKLLYIRYNYLYDHANILRYIITFYYIE